jgi:hypothetical protein
MSIATPALAETISEQTEITTLGSTDRMLVMLASGMLRHIKGSNFNAAKLNTYVITNANDAVEDGVYQLGTPFTNGPTASDYYIFHMRLGTSALYCFQWAIRVAGGGQMYHRLRINGTWDAAWTKVWNAQNDGEGSGLAADMSSTYFNDTLTSMQLQMTRMLKAFRNHAAIGFGQLALPTTGSGKYWRDICWSPSLNLYVAIAYNTNIVATSPDGRTWTSRSLPVTADWRSIAWSPERSIFVITSQGSAIACSSPDGINWTQRAMPVSGNWVAVAWGATANTTGLFCAINQGTNIAATSPDGITWTQRTLPATATWSDIEWSTAGRFCVIAYTGTNGATSNDGISWTARVLPTGPGWTSICYNEELDLFCMTAVPSGTICALSRDGITWTTHLLPASGYWIKVFVAKELGLFIALNGATPAVSHDGKTWKSSAVSGASTTWQSGCWSSERGEAILVSMDADSAALSL